MPINDGTGPGGRGPMTGRGNGFCALKLDENESSVSGYADHDTYTIELTKN